MMLNRREALVGIGVGLAVSGCTPPIEKTFGIPWSRFSSQDPDFSIDYPAYCTTKPIAEPAGVVTQEFDCAFNGSPAIIRVATEPWRGSLDEYQSYIMGRVSALTLRKIDVLATPRGSTSAGRNRVAGFDAYQVKALSERNTSTGVVASDQTFTLFVAQNRGWQVLMATPTQATQTAMPFYNHMIDTLRVKK